VGRVSVAFRGSFFFFPWYTSPPFLLVFSAERGRGNASSASTGLFLKRTSGRDPIEWADVFFFDNPSRSLPVVWSLFCCFLRAR